MSNVRVDVGGEQAHEQEEGIPDRATFHVEMVQTLQKSMFGALMSIGNETWY